LRRPHFSPAEGGEFESAAPLPPCDQPAPGGRPHQSDFLIRRAGKIPEVAIAAQMPEHGIDIGPIVPSVHRRNSHSRHPTTISRRIGFQRYYP